MVTELHDRVLVQLRRIMRATDIYSRRLGKESGLTTPQLLVLRAIIDSQDATVTKVSQDISLSQATVTSILNRLEKAGLVVRTRSEVDKRRVNLRLTAAAETLVANAPQPLQHEFVQRFEQLAEWEQHMILAAFTRVAGMMQAENLDVAPILAEPGDVSSEEAPTA